MQIYEAYKMTKFEGKVRFWKEKALALEREKAELVRRLKAMQDLVIMKTVAGKDLFDLLETCDTEKAELEGRLKAEQESVNELSLHCQELEGRLREAEEDAAILRKLLWMNHGHTGIYGDDGEMQCSECFRKFGFFDWKRTPIKEIQERFTMAALKD